MPRSRTPLDRVGAPNQSIQQRLGQYLGETAPSRLNPRFLEHRAEIQPVTSPSKGHVQQSLRLLAFPRRVIVIGLGLEVSNRHAARLTRWVGDDAHGIAPIAASA